MAQPGFMSMAATDLGFVDQDQTKAIEATKKKKKLQGSTYGKPAQPFGVQPSPASMALLGSSSLNMMGGAPARR